MKLFYKCRPVTAELAKDYALDALFNSYAVFSGRKNFNDPFDSKIDILNPTPHQILALLQRPDIDAHKKNVMSAWVSNGSFTSEGIRALDNSRAELNDLFDAYPIYSLSKHNTSNLLWAHYAACHTGFCIGFGFNGDQPKPVRYRKQIASIDLLEFLFADPSFGNKVHDALLVKHHYWAYEGERRWIASNAMGRVPKGQAFIKIPYDPKWVRTIIVGCRMPSTVKNHIRRNLPFSTEFHQAIEMKDTIEIVPFDKHLHL